MKQHKTFLLLSLLVPGAAISAHGAEVKNYRQFSCRRNFGFADELKRIFLITKASFDDGSHAEPVLAKGGSTHSAFVKTYLGKSDSALETYYRSLVFTGKASMPKTLGSDAEVEAYVAKN